MNPPLKDALERTLEAFFESGKRKDYLKNEVIVHGNDDNQAAYMIQKGYVKVYAINNRGETYVHVIYGPGEIFPVVGIFYKTVRNVFYEALTPCTILCVTQAHLLKAIQSNTQISNAMLTKALDQFRLVIDRVDNLEYKYARERLAYRLLFLTSRFGKKRADGSYIIEVQLSQQIIANSINCSRENVSREFERFQKRGLVGYEGRFIIVKSVEGFKKELQSPLSPDWWGLR